MCSFNLFGLVTMNENDEVNGGRFHSLMEVKWHMSCASSPHTKEGTNGVVKRSVCFDAPSNKTGALSTQKSSPRAVRPVHRKSRAG